jgi:MFS family permease
MHFSKAQFAESKTARWKSLPNKKQLAILFFARFVDVFQNTSLQTYIYYQLQSFQPESPDTTISTQIGWVLGIFAAAQAFTALIWARLADSKLFGRNKSLWIGLFGNCASCVGIGVSKSFGQIACWRILAGTMNATGTIV